MRNKILKLSLLGALAIGCVNATEFRSPYLSERGPIRYKFEKGDAKKYSLDFYSDVYRRESHKAFMKHSTKAKPLTSLFFNQSDFTVEQIFPNSTVPYNAQNYNPFLKLLTINPRATYYEWGANLGGRFEYPVYKDKGRIGLRANLPFRLIELEREDITDKNVDPTDGLILERWVKVETSANSASDRLDNGSMQYRLAKAYNLGFLATLFETSDSHNIAVAMANNSVKIFGQELGAAAGSLANTKRMQSEVRSGAGVIYNVSGSAYPKDPEFFNGTATSGADKLRWAYNVSDNEQRDYSTSTVDKDGKSGGASKDNYSKGISFFYKTNDYTSGILNPKPDGTYSDAAIKQMQTMWIVPGYVGGDLTSEAKGIAEGVESNLAQYAENPYQWLLKYGDGFEFEGTRRTSFGDLDIDLFYEHMFSKEWAAELMLGARIPTGSGDEFYGNPYRVQSGNGEHFELKLGGMLAWQPLSWMNMKLDIYGSHAFESTEHRCAVFAGSTIKNIGPKVDADVEWNYFVGRLDFNFFHRKTKDISGTLGYEFYWKEQDDIHFKTSSMTPWYGNAIDGTSLAANLDGKRAAANTEAIGHKIRSEGRVQFNKWLEFYGGGAYTFAGKNLPRETDFHGGAYLRF